jgi:NitT/TauT family transport system permease protein
MPDTLTPTPRISQNRRWTWIGVALLVALWWTLSALSGPLVLASPPATLRALGDMLAHRSFYENFGLSLARMGTMLAISTALGGALAGLALWDRRAARALEPLRRVCSTIPPVVIVVIAMYWIGMGSAMIVVFGGIILWPLMYVSLLEGSELCNAELRETARAFRISLPGRLRHFYLPAMAPAAMAGAVQILCSAVRVTVLAEVIGADKGMGAAIVNSARNLEVERMTAWVLVVLLLAIGAEQALMAPIRKRTYRWKKP